MQNYNNGEVSMMVQLTDACEILRWAEGAEIPVVLDGGWGVDALIGRETRTHNDIDLFVEEKDYQAFIEMIKVRGFCEVTMEYTTEHHTVWADDKARIIDLHSFRYAQDGQILYEGCMFPAKTFSGKGVIGNIAVQCIEPESQVTFHQGYAFDENDVHDVKLLCETFGLAVPEEYQKLIKSAE